MENASDALIMAGQVLIFIVALTICISSFTTVRAKVNEIVGQNEEIRMAKSGDTYINFMESKNASSNRVVGAETVVTSMYRAIKEDYVIYIKFTDPADIERIKDNNYINKMKATKNSEVKNNGEPIIKTDDVLIKVTIGSDTNQDVNKVLKEDGGNLFEIMRDKKFNEYLGEYQKNTDSSTENKKVNRIITYVET